MANFTKFCFIILFTIAIRGTSWAQATTQKEKTVIGFRTLHLVNLKSADDEGEFISIAENFNTLVAELGYQNIRYNIWKEADGSEGQYKYIFESTWPDQETFGKVHEYDRFKIVCEKNYAKWKKIMVEDI